MILYSIQNMGSSPLLSLSMFLEFLNFGHFLASRSYRKRLLECKLSTLETPVYNCLLNVKSMHTAQPEFGLIYFNY